MKATTLGSHFRAFGHHRRRAGLRNSDICRVANPLEILPGLPINWASVKGLHILF